MQSEKHRGVLQGRVITLDAPAGIPDGSVVEVVIRCDGAVSEIDRQRLVAVFGACRGDADSLDDFVAWNRIQRQRGRTGCELM